MHEAKFGEEAPMTLRLLVVPMLAIACTFPVYAADTMNADAPSLTPGRYMASIMPSINEQTGSRLEEAVGKIAGVEKVKADHGDSSLHFTIKNDAKVPVTRIQKIVAKTDSDAVMSEPVLEGSLNPHPGL